ncbi:MAG: hypothetical protein CFE34_03930 [Rhodobacteraceae bacterium PARR1]|nr:MAG: hypothetical protein CFE34_03930 [Rhodobacteraceae bacterium PARR1]
MNRSNAYYLARLRDEHPAIYADYQAGKFKNASAAIRAAGLKKVPSPLDTLKKAWSEASAAERATFRADIGCMPLTPTAAIGPVSASTTAAVGVNQIHVGGYLTPATGQKLKAVMAARGLRLGQVMFELGYSTRNASIGLALARGSLIHDQHLLDALEKWLAKQAV